MPSTVTFTLFAAIVQLPKFTKTLSELRTVADFWLYSLIEVQDQELKYINDMTTQRDINNQIKFAHDTGLAEGHKESSLEIAANMKAEGFDVNIIAKCTGLPIQEVEAL